MRFAEVNGVRTRHTNGVGNLVTGQLWRPVDTTRWRRPADAARWWWPADAARWRQPVDNAYWRRPLTASVTDDTADDDTATASDAWFAAEGAASAETEDLAEGAALGADDLARRVREGSAPAPDDWPTVAVETGFADDETDYESALREATLAAARATVRERERADDQQLIHAIRAADDARRTANELAERVAEWGGSLFELDGGPDHAGDEPEAATVPDTADAGVAYARSLADRDPDGPTEAHVVSLAKRVATLADEADQLEAYVEDHAPVVAPNLAAMAGATLAARLCSFAGGLEELAKKPSGTLQVLGAEDALFAHLRGDAPSPKHGVIYTHDYVRNTHPAERGSAARALAGKLTIAARVDHYSGDRRPELEEELDDRMATIRARRGGDGE